MKNYLTVENIIDFTQLKSEAEQYRKELVLSQALVNSLKSEIEILNKEKKENNYNPENNQLNNNINSINNRNEDHNLIMSENLSLKSNLNSQAQLINELMEENKNLKKLVDEATIKLNIKIIIQYLLMILKYLEVIAPIVITNPQIVQFSLTTKFSIKFYLITYI